MPNAAYPIVPSAATALDTSDESAIATLQRAATGPVNTGYYLPIFARFDLVDRGGPGWNWAACLCTLNWMVFRKLWGPALFYLGALLLAALLLFGVGPLLLRLSETERLSLLVATATFAFLVPGVFGNAMLYAAHRRKIAQALAASATLAEACVLLNRDSSSRQRLLGLAMANVACAGIACALWLVLPRSAALPMIGSATAALPGPPARTASAPEVARAPLPAPAASAAATTASAASPVASGQQQPASAPATSLPAAAIASAPAMAASGAAAAASAGPATVPAVPAAPSLTAAELQARADAMRTYVARRAVAVPPAPAAPSAPLTAEEEAARARALARYVPRRHAPVATAPAAGASAPTATPSDAPSDASAGDAAFFINVGLFAESDNARKAHARLVEAGLPALSQELEFPRGKRTRVRVGPFDRRADADAAAQKVRSLQLDAQVVRPQRGAN